MDPRGKLFVFSNSEARFSSVNTFHSANQNFDSTQNALHPMALLALAESPIFKQNSSAESPNLEETANNDNGHIYFNENSSMPSIIDLATTGLRRSPRIAAK